MSSWTRTETAPDGWPLHVYGWAPEGAPRGVIQILHGLAEHAGRYDRFARAACAQGWAVIAQDHRGHGASVSSPADRGHAGDVDGWTACVNDAVQVAELAVGLWPGVPLVLFGHSMGSTLAVHVARQSPSRFAAVVLSGPTGVVGPLRVFGLWATRFERWRLGCRGRSKLLHALSFGDFNKAFRPNRTEYDWLSRDPAEVDKYANDPLCGFIVTTQHWFDHLTALGLLDDVPALQGLAPSVPWLVFAGSDDPASQATRRLPPLVANLQEAGVVSVLYKVWSGGRHELLNEVNRDDVTDHVLGWLDGAVPGRS